MTLRKRPRNHFSMIDDRIESTRLKKRKMLHRNISYKIAVHRLGYINKHDCGMINVSCDRGCGALFFENETTLRKTCCMKDGHGSHESMNEIPLFVEELLKDIEFRKNIRLYNCTLQIATLGSRLGDTGFYVHTRFPFFIRIHGMLYHSIPPTIANNGNVPRFAQLYVIDNMLDEIMKTNRSSVINKEIMKRFILYIKENNALADAICRASREYFSKDKNIKLIQLNFVKGERQYESPTKKDEIAFLIPNNDTHFDAYRSVYIRNAGGAFTAIHEFHPLYDPAHYVIMFPSGDTGYALYENDIRNKISPLCFYRHRLQIREHKTLARFGRLFHEYVIDQYCKIEKQYLDYIKSHQKELCNNYTTNNDDRVEEEPMENKEKWVYLPTSFRGGARYYRTKYLDSLNIVNHLGSASYFITFTTNPNWKEIQDNLEEGEYWYDRPDIVARVFKLKSESLLKDLVINGIFGTCIGYLASPEFQKRGLPHMHILVIIAESERPKNADDVDRAISAEIPDRSDDQLFELVTRHNLHGPCEAYCLDADNKCRFHYPFDYIDETTWNGSSMVYYRRRNNGRTFVGNNHFVYTNQNVVPYNPYLLRKYQCNLCVLICSTKIASVQYLFSYTTKGLDMATVKLSLENADNEVSNYLNVRYICAPEAYWKIFNFGYVNIKPITIRLPVHLPNDRNGEQKQTELEAFFKLNYYRRELDTLLDKDLYYTEISKYYVFDSKSHFWTERKKINGDHVSGVVLNRMDNVSIRNGEQYFLRVLLNNVPNPISYRDLRTVNKREYKTFQEACKARGLLIDDEIWKQTIEEAIIVEKPQTVRVIFAQLLVFCQIQDPVLLYNMFEEQMGEDFRRKTDSDVLLSEHKIAIATELDKELIKMGRSLSDYTSLANRLSFKNKNRNIIPEIRYSLFEASNMLKRYQKTFELANNEQKNILKMLTNTFEHNINKNLFLLMSAAGTGKTFVQNAFIDFVKSKTKLNHSIVVVSTTAISAQLLPDGRTAHSTFKLPLVVREGILPECNIPLTSELATILKRTQVLIWDEIFTIRKELVEAVSRFYSKLKENPCPFGGIMVICSGDLHQTLPKLRYSTRAQIVSTCLTQSKLYPSFKILQLTKNMRLKNKLNNDFENWLLNLGKGSTRTDIEERIELPSNINTTNDLDNLINFVYTDNITCLSDTQLSERAILCPLNTNVRFLNKQIGDSFPGEYTVYKSTDQEIDSEGNIINDIPLEVLNGIIRPGFPVHKLELKKRMIVMCLRNMSRELCNGTKLRVLRLHNHIIDCRIITGPGKGNIVSIPRIILTDSSSNENLILQRKQFPLSVAYAITIDKSQGQSLKNVGIMLESDCFAHGQFYTAVGRATDENHLIIYTPDNNKIKNVVWKEVFPYCKHKIN